ncbi:cyclin-dependent kinase-like 5 [Ctenocephalides felis]|uniref:cyclin-dependent kinase-like 5 n=1 Tax=Ctenocephalides felis TaxID=7515 RepID=UPI000E6E56FE|nr:cyclin-dependent kinase-like 5 [Ctenocephalides felis]
MEKYDTLAVVGEGSYGLVMKCRHRESGTIVAIKKFLETEEDATVRKMALREIRMLKKLRHENLVNMIEVFRRKRRFYLVFEYLEHTVLDELESRGGGGLGDDLSRKYIYQVIRAVDFCHSNNVIHRDVKPENVLVSRLGVVKLCDFGFARPLAQPAETYTDYVATRWYRAPELLVGDTRYGGPVDIWAVGCLFAEMMSGDPLFPGDSDVDQLFQIVRMLGKLSTRHQHFVARNPLFKGFRKTQSQQMTEEGNGIPLYQLFPTWHRSALDLLQQCLRLDPLQRPKAPALLRHEAFMHDGFADKYLPELRQKVCTEFQSNPLLRKHQSAAILAACRQAEVPVQLQVQQLHQVESEVQEAADFEDQPQHKWRINLLGCDSVHSKRIESMDSLSTAQNSSNHLSSTHVLYNNNNHNTPTRRVPLKSDPVNSQGQIQSHMHHQQAQHAQHIHQQQQQQQMQHQQQQMLQRGLSQQHVAKSKSDTLTEKSDQISYRFNQSLQSLLQRNSNAFKDSSNHPLTRQIISNMLMEARPARRTSPTRRTSADTSSKGTSGANGGGETGDAPSPPPFHSLPPDTGGVCHQMLEPVMNSSNFAQYHRHHHHHQPHQLHPQYQQHIHQHQCSQMHQHQSHPQPKPHHYMHYSQLLPQHYSQHCTHHQQHPSQHEQILMAMQQQQQAKNRSPFSKAGVHPAPARSQQNGFDRSPISMVPRGQHIKRTPGGGLLLDATQLELINNSVNGTNSNNTITHSNTNNPLHLQQHIHQHSMQTLHPPPQHAHQTLSMHQQRHAWATPANSKGGRGRVAAGSDVQSIWRSGTKQNDDFTLPNLPGGQ